MSRLHAVDTGVAAIVVSVLLFATATASAQAITPSDVEQQVRASLLVWNTRDPVKILDTPGPSNNRGFGFGYRTRDARPGQSREEERGVIEKFLTTAEYYRATLDEIRTAVDGDIGLAWGVFTEEFHIRGRTPERVRVRFTTALKREGRAWRQLVFHRDAQPFDENGNYIPASASVR